MILQSKNNVPWCAFCRQKNSNLQISIAGFYCNMEDQIERVKAGRACVIDGGLSSRSLTSWKREGHIEGRGFHRGKPKNSYWSAQFILHGDLGYIEICVPWVSKQTNGGGGEIVLWVTEKLLFVTDKVTRWTTADKNLHGGCETLAYVSVLHQWNKDLW